jgi:hypothetical protein
MPALALSRLGARVVESGLVLTAVICPPARGSGWRRWCGSRTRGRRAASAPVRGTGVALFLWSILRLSVQVKAALAGIFGKLRGRWQTVGVVFVADAFGAWLVEQLADAGRKKLTELVLGSEQERALRRAADAAVRAVAEELSPSGGGQAGQAAMVISEVFRAPVQGAPPAGPAMLLEGLRAGIAGQLAVLDDAGLTGTGQSSADVLGVPGTVLAGRLTGHLDSPLPGHPELHCEAHVWSPAPRSLRSDRTRVCG